MEFLQSVDPLVAVLVGMPVVFTLSVGLGLLVSGEDSLRRLSFVVPGAWAALDAGFAFLVVLDGEINPGHMEIAAFQAIGLAAVAVLFGTIYAVVSAIGHLHRRHRA
ncbi:MAG: hypothetical protein Q8Q36_01725 [bacterium]|nr:hypothetical protein [bacterium]